MLLSLRSSAQNSFAKGSDVPNENGLLTRYLLYRFPLGLRLSRRSSNSQPCLKDHWGCLQIVERGRWGLHNMNLEGLTTNRSGVWERLSDNFSTTNWIPCICRGLCSFLSSLGQSFIASKEAAVSFITGTCSLHENFSVEIEINCNQYNTCCRVLVVSTVSFYEYTWAWPTKNKLLKARVLLPLGALCSYDWLVCQQYSQIYLICHRILNNIEAADNFKLTITTWFKPACHYRSKAVAQCMYQILWSNSPSA